MTADEKRQRVAQCGFWWHTIDLGDGVVTPGRKGGGDARAMAEHIDSLRIPRDLSGRSVLDIGAFDGAYSFEAERRRAERVVALDHFVWLNDIAGGQISYDVMYLEGGTVPSGTPTPGKRPFDTCHELLNSKVEAIVGDFMNYPLDELGRFDVVLYLGIIYHMEDPVRAMRRVYEVTGDMAIIESEVVALMDEDSIWRFFPDAELNDDPTNWWVPNIRALMGLARGVGFSRVEFISRDPEKARAPGEHGRATIHAWR